MNALTVHTIVQSMQLVLILVEVLLVLATLATVEMGSHVEVKLYILEYRRSGHFRVLFFSRDKFPRV